MKRTPPVYDHRGRRIKKCRRCGYYLTLDCFKVDPHGVEGRASYCRECYKEYHKARYEALRCNPRLANREEPFKLRFPRAEHKCPVCGHYYASFKELWRGSICAYCAAESVTGGGNSPCRIKAQ